MNWRLLAVLLAVLPRQARCDDGYRTGRFEMGLNPGIYIPVGVTSSLLGNSVGVQLTGGYQFNKWGTAGFEFGYAPNHSRGGITKGPYSYDYNGDGLNDRVGFSSDVREKFLQFAPFFKFGQWVDIVQIKARPYVIGGMGLYQQWFNKGTETIAGRDSVSGKNVGPIVQPISSAGNAFLGLNIGAGFEIQVDENAAMGFDLRYTRIIKPVYHAQFIIPSLRIMYLFGAGVDSRARF